jgi:hypothetical protein
VIAGGWNATVYRVEFAADGVATIELMQPNRLHSILVASTSPTLGGGEVTIKGSHDGENYAPLVSSPVVAAGLLNTVDALLRKVRIELSGHSVDVVVTVVSSMPGQKIPVKNSTTTVVEVTPV